MRDLPVEVYGQPTAKDYRRAMFSVHRWRLIVAACVFIIFALVLGLGILIMFVAKLSDPLIYYETLVPLALFALLFGLLFLDIRRKAKQIEKIIEPARFCFTNEGLEIVTSSSMVRIFWNKFYKIQETKTDFLFFTQKNIFYPVPKRLFLDRQQIAHVRNLISCNAKDNAQLLHS